MGLNLVVLSAEQYSIVIRATQVMLHKVKPHLLQEGIVQPFDKMSMLEVTTQELRVLHTDISQSLLHLHVPTGEIGHLRLDILVVWIDSPPTLLSSVSASIACTSVDATRVKVLQLQYEQA